MDRRNFLAFAGASTFSACARSRLDIPSYGNIPEVIGDILVPSNGFLSPQDIQISIHQYDTFDNQIGSEAGNRGNFERFYNLVLSRIESGNISQLPEIVRETMRHEIESAYTLNAQKGFAGYNSGKLDNPNTFFGDIGENPSIMKLGNTLYDSRIKGQIDLNSPDSLLAELGLPVGQKDVSFIVQDQNGVHIFIYYEAGKLRFVAPTSPGTIALGTTPGDGLTYNDYTNLAHYFLDDEMKGLSAEELQSIIQNERRVGGPMPYAHRVLHNGEVDGYYTHIGEVNGQPASHGCIRLPAFWAYIMFYFGKSGVPIHFNPQHKLSAESV